MLKLQSGFSLWTMNSICIAIFSTLFLKVQSSDRLVYYYAESECKHHKNDSVEFRLASYGHSSSAFIKATRFLSYSYPFNCNITVSVRNSRDAHVLLKVRKISFPFKANCRSYIMIYQGNDRGYRLCTKDDISTGKNEFTQSDSNQIKFLYHTEYNELSYISNDFFNSGFEILATAYTYAPCGKDLDFLCNNGRCISKKLVRDGYDNCGDKSDEDMYIVRKDNGLPTSSITAIIIGVLLLIAAISGIIWLVRRKRVTTTRTYTTPSQPLYPTGPQSYPQVPAPYVPYPSAPETQIQYGSEGYQKSEPYNQYGGVTNQVYGQPPPPPYN